MMDHIPISNAVVLLYLVAFGPLMMRSDDDFIMGCFQLRLEMPICRSRLFSFRVINDFVKANDEILDEIIKKFSKNI